MQFFTLNSTNTCLTIAEGLVPLYLLLKPNTRKRDLFPHDSPTQDGPRRNHRTFSVGLCSETTSGRSGSLTVCHCQRSPNSVLERRVCFNWLFQSLFPDRVLEDWVLQLGMHRSRNRKGISPMMVRRVIFFFGAMGARKKERN